MPHTPLAVGDKSDVVEETAVEDMVRMDAAVVEDRLGMGATWAVVCIERAKSSFVVPLEQDKKLLVVVIPVFQQPSAEQMEHHSQDRNVHQ
ncbi:hypothetical protein ACP8Y2_19210 [Herpetosiphon llansteffanensis]